jgi:hypothetical protein
MYRCTSARYPAIVPRFTLASCPSSHSARNWRTVSAERSTYSPRRAATRASSRAALAAASVANPPTHFGRVRPVSGSGTRIT